MGAAWTRAIFRQRRSARERSVKKFQNFIIERAVRAKFSGGSNKKVVNSEFFRLLISAKKVAGVTRGRDACCSGNHQVTVDFFFFLF
jgi:hypothetical protein